MGSRLTGFWGWEKRIGDFPELRDVLWMHGASLGECKVLLSLAARLGEWKEKIIVTTQKTEAVEPLRAQAPPGVRVTLAPLPVRFFSAVWFEQLNPRCLILCEGEWWPAWLDLCREKSVPVALISGRMSERAARLYGLFRSWWGRRMGALSAVWFQDIENAARFTGFYDGEIRVGGDWKLLGMDRMRKEIETLERQVDLACVSVHRAEWPRVGPGIAKIAELGGCVVLIPRRPDQAEWFAGKLRQMGCAVVYWPEIRRGAISLICQFGLVRDILQHSSVAAVGGSFAAIGVHNFWEPLFCGVPVIVGPFQGTASAVLNELKRRGVVGQIADLADVRMGNNARDLWLADWTPWQARRKIPEVLEHYERLVRHSVGEFIQWLRQTVPP